MWELTPLMQALRIPSGWLYTITQLVTLLQYRYITPLSQILPPGSISIYPETVSKSMSIYKREKKKEIRWRREMIDMQVF